MSEPTDSSNWTGPSSIAAPRLRGALVHRYGEHQVSTDFARIAAAQADAERQAKEMPPELTGVLGRAWLLLLSPLMLVVANQVVHATGRDLIVQDNKAYLLAWGFGVAAVALSQMVSKSLALIWARKAILVGAFLATVGVAGGYIYVAAKSRQNAAFSTPERTYELYQSSGSAPRGEQKSFISAPTGHCWVVAAGSPYRTQRPARSFNGFKGNMAFPG